MTNYLVDVIIGMAFLAAAVSSIMFLLPSSWIAVTSAGQTSLMGIDMATWSSLHKWSGIAMIGGVVLHTLLHTRWIACMTRRLLGRRTRHERPLGRPVVGTARQSAARLAPGVAGDTCATSFAGDGITRHLPSATAAPVRATGSLSVGKTGDRTPEPSTERRRDGGSRCYTRKAFLGAAATIVAGSAVVGVTLARGGAEFQSQQSGNDSGATDEAVAQTAEDQSSQTTDGASQGSARVVVDEARCTGCGSCLQMCPEGVFTLDSRTGRAEAASPDACRFCGRCIQVCGPQAITLNG